MIPLRHRLRGRGVGRQMFFWRHFLFLEGRKTKAKQQNCQTSQERKPSSWKIDFLMTMCAMFPALIMSFVEKNRSPHLAGWEVLGDAAHCAWKSRRQQQREQGCSRWRRWVLCWVFFLSRPVGLWRSVVLLKTLNILEGFSKMTHWGPVLCFVLRWIRGCPSLGLVSGCFRLRGAGHLFISGILEKQLPTTF